MKRRDFVRSTAFLGIGISLEFSRIKKWYSEDHAPLKTGDLAGLSDRLEMDFQQLLKWFKETGWTDYLEQALGVNFALSGNDLRQELIRELDQNWLAALRQNPASGYDDFSGERLIQPGFPAYSLLFHSLVNPRVRPAGVKEYPGLEQIDLLENYIYALSDWEQLRSIYKISPDEELVFAVFAYEYRPAFKTPHHAYADMVYSRTGIARIGNEPLHYDKINRCHTTEPAGDIKRKVAVMPARYGVYIARKVKNENIALVKAQSHKGDDSRDDRYDNNKTFLQPVRKVFNNDILIGEMPLQYNEVHKSEKLSKLAGDNMIILHGLKPMPKYSKDLIVQDEKQRNAGSSFLVISQQAALIRPAQENGRALFFLVPKRSKDVFDNRYFTALCTQEVEDVELLEGNEGLGRVYNKYAAPRNQPLFVNITNRSDDTTREAYHPIVKARDNKFEQDVNGGNYYAPLFEDSICDGRVAADTALFPTKKIGNISMHCLPAFSIVTAPDFFPQVDPLDFLDYDVAPGLSNESNFYEGGIASLSTARIKPNPKMIDTNGDETADTYLAVFSGAIKTSSGIASERLAVYKDPASERGYDISGFLPDVASSVFAPGWDVTYCSDNAHGIYIGTEGLGSPFVEDMKFCSALNGMWAATSPDASRTYQGSNEAKYRNPTAIPLLDTEIGICAKGPAGKARESWGWDGEQGPYLEKAGINWKINFTDLGRADAVTNALYGKFDMSLLRKLKSNELIARMECLKLCIHTLPQKNFYDEKYTARVTGYTYLWLVSAEKVNWGKEEPLASGIPADLVGNNKAWITNTHEARVSGEGYLYVFTNSAADDYNPNDEPEENKGKKPRDWTADLKRRRLDCKEIYVCQVTNDAGSSHKLAWTEIKNGKINWQVK